MNKKNVKERSLVELNCRVTFCIWRLRKESYRIASMSIQFLHLECQSKVSDVFCETSDISILTTLNTHSRCLIHAYILYIPKKGLKRWKSAGMSMLSFEKVHSRRIFSKQKLMMSKSHEKQTRYVGHVLMYQWFTLLIKNYQHRKWATSLVIHAKYMHEWLKRCFQMTSDPPLYMLKILLSKHYWICEQNIQYVR